MKGDCMEALDWKQYVGKFTVEGLMARFGSQTEMADFCGVAPSTVYQWRLKNRVPAEHVILLEKRTGVPRYVIRPDIYPVEA
jgi:DNA-binding transcriptional regulator YdaS (Cro superfamily)